jgi:FtsH-binding integral membrane protein
MQNQFDPRTTGVNTATVGVPRAARDAGLRSYMLSVYNYMASGVLLTGIVALLFAPYAQGVIVNQAGTGMTGLGWIITLAPLGFVLAMSFGLNRMSTSTLQILFWAFAVTMGLSLYGYTTKRDLSAMGTFLIMGVVGLLIAMVINMFLQSSAMMMAISAIGVLLFAGLTAYDTQKIKSMYAHVAGSDMMGKVVIMGALNLYLDFINMFMFLLQFMGDRR